MNTLIDKVVSNAQESELANVKKVDIPDFFDRQSKFLLNLGVTIESEANLTVNTQQSADTVFKKDYKDFIESSNIVFRSWKNVENVPARLISFSDSEVTVECLVDKENRIYQERTFPISIFEKQEFFIGKMFYLRLFERPNEMKLQVLDDPSLVLEDDFPKTKLAEKYKNSRLFKK